MEIFSKFPLDAINKRSRLTYIFSKEYFEFVFQNSIFVLMVIFILNLTEINIIAEEKRSKRDTITFCYFCGIERIFKLLTKVIEIYVQLTTVKIREFNLKRRFWEVFKT